jgi:sulfatase modifying factor 1
MKKGLLILFLLMLSVCNIALMAQKSTTGCYSKLKREGQIAFDAGNYPKAIGLWEAAKKCSDAPAGNNLQVLINKAKSIPYFELVLIRGGTFSMGCTDEQGSDCNSNEKPAHQVAVSDFYIGKYEVTQKEWREVMGSDISYFKNCDNCPVEQASWENIQQFLSKLNAKTGKTYRLPTETEWEYAARGGASSRGFKYAGSNSVDEVAWYNDNSNSTHPVGRKKANELGLYDMSGNVWEWCSDWYEERSTGAHTNPKDSSRGTTRVYRGGSCFDSPKLCRVSYRYGSAPSVRTRFLGFRLAL